MRNISILIIGIMDIYILNPCCSIKEGSTTVLVSGGGVADKKKFLKDLNKESKGSKKVGAAVRLAVGMMEDGRMWLQVKCTDISNNNRN